METSYRGCRGPLNRGGSHDREEKERKGMGKGARGSLEEEACMDMSYFLLQLGDVLLRMQGTHQPVGKEVMIERTKNRIGWREG